MPLSFLHLAFAAAALAAAAPTPEVSPLTVTALPKGAPKPDVTVPVSADDRMGRQHVSIWPAAAREAGLSGYVTLSCLVDVHGLAETCRVIFETPAGKGFGGAALALRPTFKLTPYQGPDGPEDSTMKVAVDFQLAQSRSNISDVMKRAAGLGGITAEGGGSIDRGGGPHEINARDLVIYDNAAPMHRITMMDSRAWSQAPDFDALAAAYPAQAAGVEGFVVAHCRVEKTGALSGCKAVKETPTGRGFAKAAVGLTSQFRVSAQALAAAPGGAPIEVDVPVRFPAAAEANDRTVRAPVWAPGHDLKTLLQSFPRSVAKPSSPGAVVKCRVGADGALTACEIELTSPDGVEFDEAAVTLASHLRMSLWSAEAGPVEGGVVHVPVRLDPGA